MRGRRHGRHMTSITNQTPAISGPKTIRGTTSVHDDAGVRHLRRTTPMLLELDREWDRLCRRRATLRTVRAWRGDGAFDAAIARLDHLDDLVTATQPRFGPPGVGDAVLLRLVELAGACELAGRVVLQRLLPGLISQSRRWMGAAPSGDPSDIAIGAAWIAIRGFDTANRTRHVAPALIADSLWIGFRRSARRRLASEVPVAGAILGAQPAPVREAEAITALAGTLRAAARAGVPTADLELLRTIVVAGGPTRAAEHCQVTVRTIRNRRDAAALRVRRALGHEWADWSDPLVAA